MNTNGKPELRNPESNSITPIQSDSATIVPNIENLEDKVGGAPDEKSLPERVKTLLIGRPLDIRDKNVFSHVSLIAFLAWVGLGADGLSSSCYGPSEAFHHLGDHKYLAIFLAMATILTVGIISICYSHIIEEFPSGGGGYLVASKLLGNKAGVISGSALLVDYILTITVSIAAMGDALFGLADQRLLPLKLPAEMVAIVVLIVLNLRGVKESVTVLVPIFILFLVTHILLITGSVTLHASAAGEVATEIFGSIRTSVSNPEIGFLGLLAVFFRAYSLGAGTYTGIEAVSNSMPVMREPKVATAKRTMLYMACSLAFTAGGLMLAFLLHKIDSDATGSKTMNQILVESLLHDVRLDQSIPGSLFLWATILSEGALLFVAAQAGFIDGPRVLANMSQDSYVPHWFGHLSERFATHNGIMLIGIAALAALWHTQGSVGTLLVMYAINVFLTFSLSMVGMSRHWWLMRKTNPLWLRRFALFVCGAVICIAILAITVYEKFLEGAYVTVIGTGACVVFCLFTRRYYDKVGEKVQKLNQALIDVSTRPEDFNSSEPIPSDPTAIVLVGGYSGLGVHTMLNATRMTPRYYKNIVFVSVAVVDVGNFKGAEAIEGLEKYTQDGLSRYVDLANRLGFASKGYMAIGADPVEELEHLCREVRKLYPSSVVFAGQLTFSRDSIYQRIFHNQTAYSLQRRLQWDGVPMVILPTRVR